jgi:hypothetical protein
MRVAVLAAVSLTILACTPAPLEFSDWTIPVPEGTPIIEYPAVPMEERTERIELVEELVIGRGDDPETRFYMPADLAVDRSGRIWVLDAFEHQVQVFDAVGNYLLAVGRQGEGPGELTAPQEVAIAGERLFVFTNSRITVWNLDGEFLDTIPLDPVNQFYAVEGTSDGNVLMWHRVFSGRFASRGQLTLLGPDGMAIGRLFDVPEPSVPTIIRDGRERLPSSILGWWIPRTALGRSGDAYVSGCDEYQIARIDPTGETQWALRVSWPRADISGEEVDSAFEELKQRRPTASRDEVYSWGRQPALAGMAVDGRGNLWVYPWIGDPLKRDERPVDVFSKDGDLLFAGMIPVRRRLNVPGEYVEDVRWLAALDDFIYSIGVDGQSEERVVVRYRLVEPF